MFKLLKELTRPPAQLTPAASGSQGTTPYTARARDRTSSPSTSRSASRNPSPSRDGSPAAFGRPRSSSNAASIRLAAIGAEKEEEDVDETEEDAIRVVELLKGIVGHAEEVEEEQTASSSTPAFSAEDVMKYVEAFSQLLSLVPHFVTRRAFRRHDGFGSLTEALRGSLSWRPKLESEAEEVWQVREVQRLEGVRLGLEVLSWAMGDRESVIYFEKNYGYPSLLPILMNLAPPTPPADTDNSDPALLPNGQILALLVAHTFSNNYTILNLYSNSNNQSESNGKAELAEKLGGDLVLRWAGSLQLLWSYLWGQPTEHSVQASRKGKEKATTQYDQRIAFGHFEGGPTSEQAHLVRLTFRILLAAAEGSTMNMLAIAHHLPSLIDFLLTRLYGPEAERKYETTFPARDDWGSQDGRGTKCGGDAEWKPPSTGLRAVYLALLRRLLEAGVKQRITWRLFGLVKVVPRPLPTAAMAETNGGSDSRNEPQTTQSPLLEEGGPSAQVTPTRAPRKGRVPLQLMIPSSIPAVDFDAERLKTEVLDLIRHGMKSRWPDLFAFRGADHESSGGLGMRDIGRPWPTPQKGFNFSCWVYITKLNQPITIFQASQANVKYPLFRIRILDNSQIGITSSIPVPAKPVVPLAADGSDPTIPAEEEEDEPAFEEIICNWPDALIPHHQWVHFAVGCRKSRTTSFAEVRIFVNGARVGALRALYPVPVVSNTPVAPPQLNVKPATHVDAIRISIGRALRDLDTKPKKDKKEGVGRTEENEWMLGRTLFVEDAVPEDLVLLMHHLGPRYQGNFQESLGKFLTYSGATSINIYLSSIAQTAADKTIPALPTNSILVKAIRAGPSILEENIILALSSKDVVPSQTEIPEHCTNAAIPHSQRAAVVKHGAVKLIGNVHAFAGTGLDESIQSVGGGTLILKIIDLAATSEELLSALTVLRDMIRDSWSASEEMERIHGFDLLAAILRPKMPTLMDVACTKILLSMLGICMDKPETATVINSVAYRSIGLEFELWSYASLGVTSLYLQHFEYLLSTSKHARFNLLRTFQKSAMIRKLLFALRSGLFDPAVVSIVVDTLRLSLVTRWSAEEAIKPVFSFMVSSLCQNNATMVLNLSQDPPPSQAGAAEVLAMMANLLHDAQRLTKLNKAVALHRLLVIFLSSNPAHYVVLPCLDILEKCLTTPGLESFQRSFENEGGFALLARILAPVWSEEIQLKVFGILLGPGEGGGGSSLLCAPVLSSLMAALEALLQAASDSEEPTSRPMSGRTRSGTITSIRSITPMTADFGLSTSSDDLRLEKLLKQLTKTYRTSGAFRRGLTARRIEVMLPTVADFAAVSSSSAKPDIVKPQREAAVQWLGALVEFSKLPPPLINQMRLIQEQLRSSINTPTPSPRSSVTSLAMSPSSPARPNSTYFGSSLTSRFGTSPSAFGPSSPSSRRRPSTAVGELALTRSRSIMEKRIPLKRVLTGESVLQEGKDKNAAWKMIILSVDNTRHGKMTLERKEHWTKLSQVDWPKRAATLRAENGIWPDEESGVTWRLDGSEGPLRMRSRLERINAVPDQGISRTRTKLRDAIPSMDELSSAVSRVNLAPWEDPFALALGEAAPIAEEEPQIASIPGKPAEPGTPDEPLDDQSFVEVEENSSDKLRRIAKTLQAGDVVEEAHNIVRIVGVDACPGLLIIGKKNLYLVDGLLQASDGEVIDAKDAPKDVLSIPSGTLVELDASEQLSRRWSYNEVIESNKRAFLFRDVALELYFSDKRNFLIVFRDRRERQGVVQKLLSKNDSRDAISRSVIGNFVLDTVAKAMDKAEAQLESMTRRWQHREISNFAYLQLLNQHANRTPNDVTQYPVFPWVLCDYMSQILDLEKDSSFRNLSFPMGALTPARREAAIERYSATEGVGEKPFHYGTHYTSSMIVCGFMIRLSPFTEIFLALQGGNFDLADRLFSSIPRAWDSASADNRGDVRELIPEFYYSPGFLLNINKHDFGKKQVSGDSVDNVVLPPWALGDPLLFVHRHREALESDYVSKHLSAWIDLTFGYKQRDPASYNCFHPLSYRGAVDLETMKDDTEKAASTAIIHNFGQTPLQIFRAPHPSRFVSGRTSLPVGVRYGVAEHWQVMLRSILPIAETATPFDDVSEALNAESKPQIQRRHRLQVAGSNLSVQWGFTDDSIRVYYADHATSMSSRLVLLVEGVPVSKAIMASSTLLLTVDHFGVLTAWRLISKGYGNKKGDITLQREATLRGHTKTVMCLGASESWSFVVSGAEDGTAMVWDTNHLRYTRTLQTGRSDPVLFCAINEADGHIALASSRYVYLFSLNGHPIASTSVDNDRIPAFNFGSDPLPSDDLEFTGGISFLKREFLKFGVLFVIGVGTEVALFRCLPGARRFEDQDVPPWRLVEQGRIPGSEDHPGGDCSMVKFIGETLYAAFKPAPGNTKYSLYQWTLPEGNARHVPESLHYSCMEDGCGRHFGLLEPRRHCGGCGGLFCGTHCVHVENFNHRYCESCRAQLSHASSLGLIGSRRGSVVPGSRRGSIVPEARGSIGALNQALPGSRLSLAAPLPRQ